MNFKKIIQASLLFLIVQEYSKALHASDQMPAYEGVEGLVAVDSKGFTAKSQQITDLKDALYQQVNRDFYKLVGQCIQQTKRSLQTFGITLNDQINISDALVQQAHAIFDQNCKQLSQAMDQVSKKALQQYYDGMQQIVGDSYFNQTDPAARQIEQTIVAWQHDIMAKMHAMIDQIFSPNNLDAIGQQVQQGVQAHEKQAAAEYGFAQNQASQDRHTTWWDEFTASSTQFLNMFDTEFAAAMQDGRFADALSQSMMIQYGASDTKPITIQAHDKAIVDGANIAIAGAKTRGSLVQNVMPVSAVNDFAELLSKMSPVSLITTNPLYASMTSTLKSRLRQIYPSNQDNSDVTVRTGIALCPQEVSFVQNRMPKVLQALQQNFGVQAPLKIALCCSGGGNRAMLTTLGYSLGLQDIGLFDATLYMAGVSGSTWTISPWSYFYATQAMSLTDFKNQLIPRLQQSAGGVAGISLPPLPGKYEQTTMSRMLSQRFGYDLYLSSIDLYGAFIGNFTMMPAGKESLKVTWSSIASQVEKGDMPLPMGAAVSFIQDQKKTGLTDYYWFEIGPFEVGSDQVGAYVTTKAFGSQFNNGTVVAGYAGQAPEYPISFYEGIYGSAFAFSANEALDRVDLNQSISVLGQNFKLPINDMIKIATPTVIADTRFYPATLHNYTQGIASSPIAKDDTIRLYDGAMDFNFPLPLVMRPARQVDLVLLCDASNNMIELKNAQIHCKKNGIKFPDLSKYAVDALENTPLTVLNDPRSADYDKDTVTILYCPLVKNSGFSTTFDPVVCAKSGVCNTFNFKYSQDQANQVIDLARYNVNSIKAEIAAVLKALESQKSGGSAKMKKKK